MAAILPHDPSESFRPRGSALLVDDDPDISPLVELALAPYNLEIEGVGDGASALARLDARDYDLMILDLGMAELDGFAVLQAMKKETRWRRIPVIVLTANKSEEALARSFGCGADDFVVKPFQPNELGIRSHRLIRPLAIPLISRWPDRGMGGSVAGRSGILDY